MQTNESGKIRSFTPIDNEVKRVFFEGDNDLDYGDFAVYVYIAMHIQISDDAGKGKPNGKQGFCYKTKVAMAGELSISRMKLDKAIAKLIEYGFVGTREVPNKYGGRPLLEYRLADDWKRFIQVDV